MPETRAAFRHPLDVRFRDCDSMGHVNNAVFFTFFEQCRLTFWRSLTGDASPLARVIVAHAECDYRAPAYFADQLEVRLNVGDIGRSSFVLTYEVENLGTGSLLAVGQTVMVTYDYAAGKSVPIPEATRALLEAHRAANHQD
jgi:acyl-CoA thioester hydrolase